MRKKQLQKSGYNKKEKEKKGGGEKRKKEIYICNIKQTNKKKIEKSK